MVSNLQPSLTLRNNLINAILVAVNDLGSGSKVRIYSGVQPASPDVAITDQTLLVELTCLFNPNSVNSGTIYFNPITSKVAVGTGIATWFRLVGVNTNTVTIDGSVGISGCDLNLINTNIRAGQSVGIKTIINNGKNVANWWLSEFGSEGNYSINAHANILETTDQLNIDTDTVNRINAILNEAKDSLAINSVLYGIINAHAAIIESTDITTALFKLIDKSHLLLIESKDTVAIATGSFSAIHGSLSLMESKDSLVINSHEQVHGHITNVEISDILNFRARTNASAQLQLTSRTFVNDSTSPISNNYHTQTVGIAFKKGDLPIGQWPSVQLLDGTLIPWSKGPESRWSDGSLKHMGIFMRIPRPIGGTHNITNVSKSNPCVVTCPGHTFLNGSQVYINNVLGAIQINGDKWVSDGNPAAVGKHYTAWNVNSTAFSIYDMTSNVAINSSTWNTYTSGGTVQGAVTAYFYTGGIAPANSTVRNTSEVIPYKVAIEVDAAVNCLRTGTLKSSLEYIPDSDTRTKIYMDGDAGTAYRFIIPFKDSSKVPEGFIYGNHYVISLTDENNNLAGIRHLGRGRNPYFTNSISGNTSANTQHGWRGFDDVRVTANGGYSYSYMTDYPKNVAYQFGGKLKSSFVVVNGGSGYSPSTTTFSFSGGNLDLTNSYSRSFNPTSFHVTTNASTGAIISASYSGSVGNNYLSCPSVTVLGNGSGAVLKMQMEPNFMCVDESNNTIAPNFDTLVYCVINAHPSTISLPTFVSNVISIASIDSSTDPTKNIVKNRIVLADHTPNQGPGGLTVVDAAQGPFYLQAKPWLAPYCGWITADANSKWRYFSGTKSIDSSLRAQMTYDELMYMRSTGIIPPYNLEDGFGKIWPVSATSPNYPNYSTFDIMNLGPMTRSQHTTGERGEIAPVMEWHARYLFTQHRDDEKLTKQTGYYQTYCPYDVKWHPSSPTPETFPNGLNSTDVFAGMSVGNKVWRYTGSSGTELNGPFLNSKNTLLLQALGNGFIMSGEHLPQFSAFPYIMFGSPEWLDLIVEQGSYCLLSGYSAYTPDKVSATPYKSGGPRNCIVGSNTYYGRIVSSGSIRADAWVGNPVWNAAGLCPEVHPDAAGYKNYFMTITNRTFKSLKDWLPMINTVNPFAYTNGIWAPNSQNYDESPWMTNYYMMTLDRPIVLCENSDAAVIAEHVKKWWEYIYSKNGSDFLLTCYRNLIKKSYDGVEWIDNDSLAGSWIATVSYSNTTGLFTSSDKYNFQFAEGDSHIFTSYNKDTKVYNGPGGFTPFTPYHTTNVNMISSNSSVRTYTFNLKDSLGNIVLPTTTGQASGGSPDPATVFTILANTAAIPSNTPVGASGTASYAAGGANGLSAIKASGVPVNSACITDLRNRISPSQPYPTAYIGSGGDWVKYFYTDHF